MSVTLRYACPGCGRDDGINHDALFEDSTWWRRNTCHCGWSGPTAPSLDTADAAWNARAADAQTEALAQWMHARGIATGHGDAVADLLRELARDWDARAPALRWRREPPDVPGRWWCREATDPRPYIMRIVDVYPRAAGVEWAGPIPEPEEQAK